MRDLAKLLSRIGVAAAVLCLACCRTIPTAPPADPAEGDARFPAAEFGRLVDVYGLHRRNGNSDVRLFRSGVLIGMETGSRSGTAAGSPLEFLPSNPDSLRRRLLIRRDLGSLEFAATLSDLQSGVSKLESGPGRDPVPRNAAIRVSFRPDVNLERIAKHAAFQLLDLADANRVIPTSIVARGSTVTIDPVMIGTAALRRGVPHAVGMPASRGRELPNIRLKVDLGRVLAVRGGAGKVDWDFRTGNAADDSPRMASGFAREFTPPRVLGEMAMYLERVQRPDSTTRLLTIFRGKLDQGIDRGDVLRVYPGSSLVPIAALEVLRDARDPLGKTTRRTRVLVRAIRGPNGADVLEQLDSSNFRGFPGRAGKQRDTFLVEHGTRIVLVTAFDATGGDDLREFIQFSATEGSAAEPGGGIPPDGECDRRVRPADGPAIPASVGCAVLHEPGARAAQGQAPSVPHPQQAFCAASYATRRFK